MPVVLEPRSELQQPPHLQLVVCSEAIPPILLQTRSLVEQHRVSLKKMERPVRDSSAASRTSQTHRNLEEGSDSPRQLAACSTKQHQEALAAHLRREAQLRLGLDSSSPLPAEVPSEAKLQQLAVLLLVGYLVKSLLHKRNHSVAAKPLAEHHLSSEPQTTNKLSSNSNLRHLAALPMQAS